MFINWPEIQRDLDRLGQGGAKVASRVSNAGVRAAITTSTKEVPAIYNVKPGDVRKAFSGSTFASSSIGAGSQSAFAIARGKRIPAYKFGGHPAKYKGAIQASVEIIKGSRKLIKGRYGRGGFTATVHGGASNNRAKRLANQGDAGHTSIWERTSTKRDPLREASGPDIPALIESHRIRQKIETEISYKVNKEFIRQCRFVLGIK